MFNKEKDEEKSSRGIFRSIVFRLVKKHIAGSTFSSALQSVRTNNAEGMHTTVTLLNEHVDDAGKARYNANSYMQVVREVSRLHLNAGISVRLSQLGYNVDEAVLDKSLTSVMEEACNRGANIWIEYEKGIPLQEMFAVYRKYRQGCKTLGVELPVLYHMDASTIKSMVKKGDNIKLVSFSYTNGNSKEKKSKEKAKQQKENGNGNSAGLFESYIAKIGRLLQSDANVCVLEPDEKLISRIAGFSKEYKKDLIFELPLGYNSKKMKKLSKAKLRLGVYLPYGKDWAPYVVNKLAEGRARNLAAKMLAER